MRGLQGTGQCLLQAPGWGWGSVPLARLDFPYSLPLLLAPVLTTSLPPRHCRYMPWVGQINALEPAMQDLTLEALKAKTTEFRGRLSRGTTLDDLLPEAFAVVREVSSRVLRLRHYDVQMVRPPPGDRPAFQKGPDWPQALRCAVVRNVPNCMLRLRHHEVQPGRPAWELLWPKGRSPCSTTECRH